jgi:hypothetical protein
MPIYKFTNIETSQPFLVKVSIINNVEEYCCAIRFALNQTGWTQDKLTCVRYPYSTSEKGDDLDCTIALPPEDLEKDLRHDPQWLMGIGDVCRHVLFGPVFLYGYVTSGDRREKAQGNLRVRYRNPLTGQIDATIVTASELRWDSSTNA